MLLNLKLQFAHEVYVLSPSETSADGHSTKVHLLDALRTSNNLKIFLIFTIVIALVLALALFLKSRPLLKNLGRFINKATIFVPDFIRVVFGLSLIFSASHQVVFGPELPAQAFSLHQIIVPFLYISGISLILGLGTRLFGILTALFWLFALFDKGWYLITYVHYFGESIALILLSRQKFSLDRFMWKTKKTVSASYQRWAMPTARILFGFSILYAAINVKFVTAALSLDVVNHYELTRYFHFDPLFIVLGAGLVESLVAVLYLLGLLQRLNSIVLVTFLTLSIWFFKESVWPHYLLLGLAIGIFMHKPDILAADRYLFRKSTDSK